VGAAAGTAELRWLYDGYVAACGRFQVAEDAHREAKETFIPLFEALNWAASFELLMEERGQALGELMDAFGYARNRVHHQWAAALEPVEARFGPVRAPGGLQIAGTYVEWSWKPLDQLPPAEIPDPDGKTAYPKQLADRPVRPTLRGLQDIFDRHI
jgi:hypothetical protein